MKFLKCIKITKGNTAAARTYQNLLTCAHDEELFRFFTTSVVSKVVIDDNGEFLSEEELAPTKGIIKSFSISPDGKFLE